MPSYTKKYRKNKRKTRRSHRRRTQRGGGCGCSSSGGENNLQNVSSLPAQQSFSQFRGGRSRRRRGSSKQRGGGFFDFLTSNQTINPIANFGTTAGAYSNSKMLYGSPNIDPSPNKQAVSYYNNSSNMRVA